MHTNTTIKQADI